MNSKLPRPLTKRILPLEKLLIAAQFIVHEPRALAEPQHRRPLSRHPAVVVGLRAAVRCGAEEGVGALGEGDVDYDGGGEGEQALPEEVAESPGCVGCEGWEEEGAVDAVDFGHVPWGLGDVGGC